MFNGSTQPVMQRIGDRELWFSPLTFQDCCLIDNHIRGRVLAAARNSLPETATEGERRETLDAAFRTLTGLSFLGGRASDGFLSTFEGIVFLGWVSLKTRQPEITLDEVAGLLFDKDVQMTFMSMIKAQMGRPSSDPKKATGAAQKGRSNPSKSTRR